MAAFVGNNRDMGGQYGRYRFPSVRVVKQPEWPRLGFWRRRSLGRRPTQWREIGHSVLAHVVGLWPIVAVVMLGMGLMWTAAMHNSP